MDRERKQLDALLTRAAAINFEIDGLNTLDELDEAQVTRWDSLVSEGETLAKEEPALRARIDSLDAIRALRDKQGVSVDSGVKEVHQMTRTDNPYDVDAARINIGVTSKSELRGRALKAVEEESSYSMSDAGKESVTHLLEAVDDTRGTIAKLVLATGPEAYRSAFGKYITGDERSMTAEERDTVAQANGLIRAAGLTTTSGGFAIPFPIDPTLILTNSGVNGSFRDFSRNVTITTNAWQGVSAGAVAASWDGESNVSSDDTPTWAQPSVPVYKAQATVPFSIEIGEDYPNFAGDLMEAIVAGKDELEATAFATGTGSSAPTGIVVALTGGSYITTSTTSDTFAVADIYKVFQALLPKYRSNASWVMNLNVLNLIRQFGTTSYHTELAQLGDGSPDRLLGRPVYESSAMDGVLDSAADNYFAVVGDFRNYVIANRVGLSVELIPHMFADASGSLPVGNRALYAYWRTGADSVNDKAFQMLNVT